MKRISKFVAAAGITAGMFVAGTAHAHGIWFAERATQLALLYGVGADDLDAVKRKDMVSSIAAYDASGKAVDTGLTVDGRLLLVNTDNQPALVAAVLQNGTWSKTPDGKWHKKGKDEVPTAVLSEKNVKYAVAIRGPLTKPVPLLPEQTLQIIPVASKLPALLGDELKVQVMYKGKPVAGAKVLRDWINDPDAKPMLSDAHGYVTFPVRNQGMNVIVAVFNSPSDEPTKYNAVENLASLTFTLPHAPE